ncbi:MAG TPA: hypothetical protein VM513_20860 [Kofleriaceae bacterium]|nr:hypothetical protein [Kofleriaceae bacterium]
MRRGLVLCLLAGCHVTATSELVRPTATRITHHPGRAIAHAPTLVLTEHGTLRFIEPLTCPTTEVVTVEHGVEVETRPNLATFIVGVIATGVGGVLAVTGAAGDDPISDPLTWAGAAGIVVGAPLAIGPWLGNRSVLAPGGPPTTDQRAGRDEPCGARSLAAHSATLTMRGIEVHGTIDGDGTFSVSPFQLVDAFATGEVTTWSVTAIVDGRATLQAEVDGRALAAGARTFLARADFDATIAPMRVVPGIVPGPLRASLTSTATGAALRVVLPLENDGPGDAYALRGHLVSSTKAVDGRVLYIGHLARGARITRELLVPLSPRAADALRGASLELSIELVDAHGTAPSTPVRFQGAVLGDAPR